MPSVSTRALRIADAGVVLFVLASIGIAVWVYSEIREVRSVATTLATTGRGVERAGDALQGLPDLAGGEIQQLGDDARKSGRQAQASARDTRDSLNTISILAGVAIALLPTAAVLLVYVPMRLALRGPPQ
jgi:hypothetical protein